MWVSDLKNRHAVSLRRLFPSASFVGCADIHVTSVSENSKDCSLGCLFAAIPGTKADGSEFIQEAIAKGAVSLLSDRPQPGVALPQCVVPHVRTAHGILCQALYGLPSRRLKTVGITGTNGKTTTTYLVRSILQAASLQTGLLGTIEYHDGTLSEVSHLTTPDAPTLASWLHRMTENKTTHAVFELSSHALHQGRTAGVELDAAVVTNMTHDHLDYHQTFESYLESKAQILKQIKPEGSVILNQDDLYARALRSDCGSQHKVVLHSSQKEAQVFATQIVETLTETRFLLHLPETTIPIQTLLIGRHNIDNCLSAAAACRELGIPPEAIAEGIEQLENVPGRLEAVEAGQDYNIFVDYAHTDDALARCLDTLKPLTKNRLICVFGAGGDRDRTKRPKLAKAAAKADRVIVTSDNPRSEDPDQIIEDILKGFAGESSQVQTEPDRRLAIRLAMESAEPGDTILVAGKGHETYQIIGEERHAFDDREIIRDNLKQTAMRMSA